MAACDLESMLAELPGCQSERVFSVTQSLDTMGRFIVSVSYPVKGARQIGVRSIFINSGPQVRTFRPPI